MLFVLTAFHVPLGTLKLLPLHLFESLPLFLPDLFLQLLHCCFLLLLHDPLHLFKSDPLLKLLHQPLLLCLSGLFLLLLGTCLMKLFHSLFLHQFLVDPLSHFILCLTLLASSITTCMHVSTWVCVCVWVGGGCVGEQAILIVGWKHLLWWSRQYS